MAAMSRFEAADAAASLERCRERLSLAARMGLWTSGVVDDWGARCARDNASFDRLRQHSHQMLPNHTAWSRQKMHDMGRETHLLHALKKLIQTHSTGLGQFLGALFLLPMLTNLFGVFFIFKPKEFVAGHGYAG